MKINTQINPDYTLLKSYMQLDDQRQTVKLDYQKGAGYLPPVVSPTITSYIVNHSGKLNKVTRILANDTTLKNYNFTGVNHELSEDEYDTLNGFWNKYNKYQLSLAVQERYQYGYGACEILLDEKQQPYRIVQFPAQTTVIRKINDNYYAVQRHVQDGEKRLRLFQDLDKYPSEDNDLPICLWLGGGATHEYYDTPLWYPERDSVLAKINLNMLNADQLNNGNNIDGILNIFGPPQRPNPETGERPEDRLRTQMQNAGTGTVVNYMESASKDFPLTMEYVRIGNDNWSYLSELSEQCDNNVMSMYSIPHIRMMIDDSKESMNSNKSDTIWEIYTNDLEDEQVSNELLIQEFNQWAFGINAEVDMAVPIFSDKKQIETDNILRLFQSGLLTLGQSCKQLEGIHPSLTFEEEDYNTPYMKQRYYNGQPFNMEDDTSFDEIFDWLRDSGYND